MLLTQESELNNITNDYNSISPKNLNSELINDDLINSQSLFDNNKEVSIPDFINFVIIIDCTFPKKPPKVLLKTNVSNFFS